MDVNTYALEMLARDRLARARREAADHALATRAARPRASVRLRLGLLLIGAGRWLRGSGVRWRGGVGGRLESKVA